MESTCYLMLWLDKDLKAVSAGFYSDGPGGITRCGNGVPVVVFEGRGETFEEAIDSAASYLAATCQHSSQSRKIFGLLGDRGKHWVLKASVELGGL